MSERKFDRAEILGRLKAVERGEMTMYERELEAKHLAAVEEVMRESGRSAGLRAQVKELEKRERRLREALEAATRYIADSEGDWDMAGRFTGRPLRGATAMTGLEKLRALASGEDIASDQLSPEMRRYLGELAAQIGQEIGELLRSEIERGEQYRVATAKLTDKNAMLHARVKALREALDALLLIAEEIEAAGKLTWAEAIRQLAQDREQQR